MPKPKIPASRPQQTSTSTRSKLSHKADAQPFQFGHLPREIRDQIYPLLLVNPDPISIRVQEEYDFDGESLDEALSRIDYDPDAVQLSSPKNHTIEAGILLVNSTIYDEAIPILYGQNTFEFVGPTPWIDFCLFNCNLRNSNSRHLRKVSVDFPDLERLATSFRGSKAWDVMMLKRMENLETLGFSVSEDIMAHDVEHLKKLRDICDKANQRRLQRKEKERNKRQGEMTDQGKDRGQANDNGPCRMDFRFYKLPVMDARASYDERKVRISTRAFESIQSWGWSIEGDFELIGQHHPFDNEEEWRRCLRKERDNGVRFGLRSVNSRVSGRSVV